MRRCLIQSYTRRLLSIQTIMKKYYNKNINIFKNINITFSIFSISTCHLFVYEQINMELDLNNDTLKTVEPAFSKHRHIQALILEFRDSAKSRAIQ